VQAGQTLSDAYKVECGVRQGCPLSGSLFNLFINDLFDGLCPIEIPGMPYNAPHIRGLLFADDAVVFGDSLDAIQQAAATVEEWALKWGMTFGVKKCGVMHFRHDKGPTSYTNLHNVRLHDLPVPFVTEYRYLGAVIDTKLEFDEWIKQKCESVRKVRMALHPFLSNHAFSPRLKLSVISATVTATARYGLEVIGGSATKLRPLQTEINNALYTALGARRSAALAPLMLETSTHSILAASIIMRMRLFRKAGSLRTPIRWFCMGEPNPVRRDNGHRAAKMYWSRQTKTTITRAFTTNGLAPRSADDKRRFSQEHTIKGAGNDASRHYISAQFINTASYLTSTTQSRTSAQSTRILLLARAGALWTTKLARHANILDPQCPFTPGRCILCDAPIRPKHEMAHIFVKCASTQAHRTRLGIQPAVNFISRLLPVTSDCVDLYTLLIGGAVKKYAEAPGRPRVEHAVTFEGFLPLLSLIHI
jgi:hypothetical protein